MEDVVSKTQFKARALHYFRQVERTGKPLVVTDRGRPTLRITPYVHDAEEPLRSLRGSVLKYEDPTEPLAIEDWEILS
jgi:prevent-host-death family protein